MRSPTGVVVTILAVLRRRIGRRGRCPGLCVAWAKLDGRMNKDHASAGPAIDQCSVVFATLGIGAAITRSRVRRRAKCRCCCYRLFFIPCGWLGRTADHNLSAARMPVVISLV